VHSASENFSGGMCVFLVKSFQENVIAEAAARDEIQCVGLTLRGIMENGPSGGRIWRRVHLGLRRRGKAKSKSPLSLYQLVPHNKHRVHVH
jgi:hypothetical protein